MRGPARWDVVVVGGANTDYLVRGPRLPAPGQAVDGETFQEAAGGKGANQAVAASRLGARVALLACLGADARGAAIVDTLQNEGVDTDHVVRVPGTRAAATVPTGVALIMLDRSGEKQTLAAPGANRRLSVTDVERAADMITATKVLLVQLEVPLPVVEAAILLADEAGATVVLDPAPPVPLPDELLRCVDVIKPNAAEAEALTGVRVHDRASARAAAEQLLARGVGAVAVQAGDEGNLLVWRPSEEGDAADTRAPVGDRFRECWLPKLAVHSVDTTGAGDAFAAGLAMALSEERSLPEAGRLASAAAALATTELGAQAGLPDRADAESLLAREYPDSSGTGPASV